MSKEKPEVGDVWEEKSLKIKYVFLEVTGHGSFVFAKYSGKTKDVIFIKCDKYKGLKYLGKSKVSIKELFDVDSN